MADLSYNQRWIEINADALANNVKVLKSAVSPSKLMAVIKANAYGHGAKLAAPILLDAGADAFGVTTIDEAQELLDARIDSKATPILCFAPISDSDALAWAIENNLHLTICDQPSLDLAQNAEAKIGKSANLHFKIDTGMGRLGLQAKEALPVISARKSWAGVYTHFANASSKSQSSTMRALKEFEGIIKRVKKQGVKIDTYHCANSAAALRFPNTRLDMVRIGTALYGQMPSEYVTKPDGLRSDTFALKARVLQVKELQKGDTVGYGSEFRASGKMRVAVIPIGFADGFGVAPTSLYSGIRGLGRVLKSGSSPLAVSISGQTAEILGRVAMQMVVVNASKLSGNIESGTIVDIPIRRLTASALIPRILVKD